MEINNFPNYLIYKDGRVFSKKRDRFLKGGFNGIYQRYSLRHNGIQKTLLLHHLVAKHYLPNPNNYPIIDHIDRNQLNNNVNNLRWCRHIDNSHNTGKYSTNTSGHKNIYFRTARKSWKYCFRYNGKGIFNRQFKNKIDCICYKFICLLRQRKMIN